MFNTTNALVLREVRYKEADRILTLFTLADGKLTARARGALRKGSKTAAATQQLTYSELTLFGNKGRWTVNEASVIEPLQGLREDMGKLALGCYFSECLEALSVEDQPDEALLQLGLNSLYALSRGMYEPEHIKAGFELRLMCLAGYEPNVHACALCGREEPVDPVLGLENGGVCCRACRSAEFGSAAALGDQAFKALRHIVLAPAKQIFAFKTDDTTLKSLGEAAERCLLAHTERGFSTLDYWKKVR